MSYRLLARLARVREEYLAARAAVDHLAARWPPPDPPPGLELLQPQHPRRAASNLEATYIIRLFAEFEALLAYHLRVVRRRQSAPRTAAALINRVALAERLPDATRDGAHMIREYRNTLVHPVAAHAARIGFQQAAATLNRFVAPLPERP